MSVDRPRPLVAGNWKMNGLRRSARSAARGRGRLHARRCGPRSSSSSARPRPCVTPSPARRSARGSRIGGQDCHAKAVGRLHRRRLGRDAGGCRAPPTSSSAIRSGGSTMARRTRTSRQGAGGPPRRADGRSSASARPGRSARRARRWRRARAARRLAPGGRDGPQPRRRLRAGLGDRHRPDADRGRRRRGPRR